MEAGWKKELEQLGVNFETGLARFVGNERLFLDFLIKFPKDKSFESMVGEIQNGNCEEAFKAAHTLKGVAGNLSLDGFYKALAPLVEDLRLGELNAAKEKAEGVGNKYYELVEALNKIQEQG